MPFQFQQTADYGTSNPIVARVLFQWFDILKFYRLPKDRHDLIMFALHSEVVPRMIQCERIAASLKADVSKGLAEGIKPQGKAIGLPSALNLKNRAEDFLLNAQMALRDYSAVFAPLLGKKILKGNMGLVLKWAEKELGADDIFTKELRRDHDGWITYILDMRDVIAHPDSKKGPFTIHNFETVGGQLAEPTWHLRGKARASIVAEMETINNNLLLCCEMTFFNALGLLPLTAPCMIVEIPEAQRDPANPIRFRMGIAN